VVTLFSLTHNPISPIVPLSKSEFLSLSVYPAAIQLRFLQTLTEVATEKNSTTILALPIDLLTAFLQKKEKE
jgi:hypothetical protein